MSLVDWGYPEQVLLGEIEDDSWLDRWREFYRPFRVGRKILIKPTWADVDVEEGLLLIQLDPGMAFGCGTHPTTSMCMALLEEIIRGGETVLDVGTGSGILAITAAKLGASRVLAVDSDPVAVRVARENLVVNGVENYVTVWEGNLLDGVDQPSDVIVANIVADVIMQLLPQAVTLLKKGGRFIASGVIDHRREEVLAVLAASGLVIIKTLNSGEWVSFLAEKPVL